MSRLARAQTVVGSAAVTAISAWLLYSGVNAFERVRNSNLARQLIDDGRFDEAGGPLSQWIERQPESAEARFLAARRAFGLGRLDAGISELTAAQKLGYDANAVSRESGIVLSRVGRLSEAEALLRPLFKARAGERSADPDPDLDEALARCYIENFQLRSADEVVNRWMLDAPTSANAHFWHAELKKRKSGIELPTLIRDYEHVLNLDPNHERARIALADLYLQVHRNADAEREYLRYREHHPDSIEVCLGLGQIAAENGQIDRAIQFLDQAIALAPGDARPLVERGKIESRRGDFTAALRFLDKAVSVDRVEPEIRYQRSLILSRLGRADDALSDQEEMRRLRKEKEEFDQLLAGLLAFPADTDRQIQAARWFFEHGHPTEGVRWAEKILREHAHHPETNRLLADHYDKQGNRGLANFYRLQADAR